MRTVARVLFFLYVPIVIVTAALALVDPPTGQGYTGFFALIAAFAVGLPWSLVPAAVHAGSGLANAFGQYEDAALMWLFWACSGPNVWLLARWAFRKQVGAVVSERLD